MKKYILVGTGIALTTLIVKVGIDVWHLRSAVNDLYDFVEQQLFDKDFELIIEDF